jgi:hypothetical protein
MLRMRGHVKRFMSKDTFLGSQDCHLRTRVLKAFQKSEKRAVTILPFRPQHFLSDLIQTTQGVQAQSSFVGSHHNDETRYGRIQVTMPFVFSESL